MFCGNGLNLIYENRICWAVLVALELLTLGNADGQTNRYWYDASCENRWDAVLAGIGDSTVKLVSSDGTSQDVPLHLLHEADQGFVKACKISAKAAVLLTQTPYVTDAHELRDLRDRLIANHVSEQLATKLALPLSVTKIPFVCDRQLSDITKRWVEIQGMHYQVVRAQLSPSLSGIKELAVRRPDGTEETVTADWVKEVRILPAFWRGITYRLPGKELTSGQSLAHFRGPGSCLTVLPELSWKDSLAFDPIDGVWTDQRTREAHELLREAGTLWERARGPRALRRESEKPGT